MIEIRKYRPIRLFWWKIVEGGRVLADGFASKREAREYLERRPR